MARLNYLPFFLGSLLSCSLKAAGPTISFDILQSLSKKSHPFSYNLNPLVLSGPEKEAPVMVVCHGYGDNYSLAHYLHEMKVTSHHIVGFNFPDHGITAGDDHTKSSFGTVHEILPLLYLLKTCVIDFQLSTINLYGFSAGGGAVINALATLHTHRFDAELAQIGISGADKQTIMKALTAGIVILECPLKSVTEIIDSRGTSPELTALAGQYTRNKMHPLEVLTSLTGIALTLFLYFENPDDILSNRDDMLFIQQLKQANKGQTIVTLGYEGGHTAHHSRLWNSVNAH